MTVSLNFDLSWSKLWLFAGCPSGVIVKAMDCGIVLSSNSSRAIMLIFEQIPWDKVWNPFSS